MLSHALYGNTISVWINVSLWSARIVPALSQNLVPPRIRLPLQALREQEEAGQTHEVMADLLAVMDFTALMGSRRTCFGMLGVCF